MVCGCLAWNPTLMETVNRLQYNITHGIGPYAKAGTQEDTHEEEEDDDEDTQGGGSAFTVPWARRRRERRGRGGRG